MNSLTNLIKDDSGATLVEYGLIIALIAIVCIAAITTIGKNMNTMFTKIGTDV